MRTHRQHHAGSSARRYASQLRRTEIRQHHRQAVLWLIPSALVGFGVLVLASRVLPANGSSTALLAGLAVPASVAARIYRTGEEVRRWRHGADGERRTARLLHSLTPRGWTVLHDRAIPGHHLALLPDGRGAVYIATKAWHARSHVAVRNGILYYGEANRTAQLASVQWEAHQAAKALGVPVSPVIAVHGAAVRGGRLSLDGVIVLDARRLRRQLRSIPHQRDPQAAQALAERAEAALPRHTTN
ncbi:NERD domain-containing protein [Streptomyces sp. H10-C2]|uniref:NERD domain-containing protein n=1 Tax=unclassified Streptomyces TaxID=2593676 RepID=UPI0024BB6B61|nr:MULTISPECIES: NERD domain-containing protein [unclassified Streptomyces]MDJ0345892.1 NERD domain-containing protein [Streptomyces sp. PH10-H1]MDJ0374741.1 NERD domain-containing protein [Streptomyces sp. H10-C2]